MAVPTFVDRVVLHVTAGRGGNGGAGGRTGDSHGGAIYSTGSLTITDTTFTKNEAKAEANATTRAMAMAQNDPQTDDAPHAKGLAIPGSQADPERSPQP